MAGREPEPGEAQDGIYRRTWKDFWHGKGEFWVSTILALGAAAFGGLVIPAPQDRVWAALLGLVLGFVAGLALCLGWHFMRSPFRQRDDARRDAGRLEAELAARDRIDFQVNLIEPEYIGRQVRRNDGSV
ncbi:MAG: hypothetical protein ACXVJF_16825, partial [Acidimicrobiia bacterium]